MSMLVGLYDDLATVQQVVQDLRDKGFGQGDMHLATYDERIQQRGPEGFFDKLSGLFGRQPHNVGGETQDLVSQMTGWGIPRQDAENYAEAMRRGSTVMMLKTPDDRVAAAKDIMDGYDPIDIQERSGQWRAQGWQGYDTNAKPFTREQIAQDRAQNQSRDLGREQTSNQAHGSDQGEEKRIPIVEEQMNVDKRQVQRGGVRVHQTVTEQPFEETHNLRDETVNVERRDADRDLDDADLNAAFQEQTFEIIETDEELIADKQAHVTGEVLISKQVEEHPETVRDTLRRTDVQAEDMGSRQDRGGMDTAGFDQDYRNHYDLVYNNRGHDYNYYKHGYQYGHSLAGMDQYRSQKWTDVEPQARRDWERQHPNESWDDFRDAIRYGWERASARGAADTGASTGFTGSEGYGTERGQGGYTDTEIP